MDEQIVVEMSNLSIVPKKVPCDDCGYKRYPHELTKIPACADSCCGFGGCCWKSVCSSKCKFKFYCHVCDKEFIRSIKQDYSTCGEEVETKCKKCYTKLFHNISWWGMTCRETEEKYG